jgi:hypothetical protein
VYKQNWKLKWAKQMEHLDNKMMLFRFNHWNHSYFHYKESIKWHLASVLYRIRYTLKVIAPTKPSKPDICDLAIQLIFFVLWTLIFQFEFYFWLTFILKWSFNLINIIKCDLFCGTGFIFTSNCISVTHNTCMEVPSN